MESLKSEISDETAKNNDATSEDSINSKKPAPQRPTTLDMKATTTQPAAPPTAIADDSSPKKATRADCLRLLRQSFDGYDYNGNGTVAHEEVMEAWALCQQEWKMHLDEKRCELEATIFMKDIDKGGDGQVDFGEYVKYFRHKLKVCEGGEIQRKKIVVEIREFQTPMTTSTFETIPQQQQATRADCLRLLRQSFDGYDYNGNGTVAHEEVREAWALCQQEWKIPLDEKRCELEATIFMKDMDVERKNSVTFHDYVIYFQHLWRMSRGEQE
ncbi:hypothetical protein HELRODRAFT_163184 [Helobdella robusta]|uniref:EF-hand domain-containing protein n=1 Tax=Helobdella robusta TaxID=6412 RepID=T1ETR9_HELRO|nr:hypothetical protein HELRODRAFT_163184 [Helobdella robusta]ESN96152.1 hypothetical protein HELRODRAFT_163184 [Helobdella robusta]